MRPVGGRGQCWHFARGIAIFTADAVGLVELNRKIQRYVTLGPGRRSVFAPSFKQAHRKAHGGAHGTVTANTLNPSMAAVTPSQLDARGVRPAHADRFVELLLASHLANRPDAGDIICHCRADGPPPQRS
jgi:hypothetical protein